MTCRDCQCHPCYCGVHFRNSDMEYKEGREPAKIPPGTGQQNVCPSSSSPARYRELGGKHRSPPTGLRHVSKLCDELRQRFADDYANPVDKLPPLEEYFSQLRTCRLCGADKHLLNGIVNEFVGEPPRFLCHDCVGEPDEPLPERVQSSSLQIRLF